MRAFGQLTRVGVEGTGVYRAGLTRLLQAEHIDVIEIDRPGRKTRRFQGKSDPIDAIQAAKTALAGGRTGAPSNATAVSRHYGTCASPGAARSTSAPTPNAASKP
ncbi:MAG TPA: hypothetical protein VFV66_24055 [Nonomuraea sp.]|nr:hypothetical protein [Nonomuraea sp.]